jgi:hypothetical protein
VFEILAYSEWSATVQSKLLKDCLESTVRYKAKSVLCSGLVLWYLTPLSTTCFRYDII